MKTAWLRDLLIEYLKAQNPYPEDIFKQVGKEARWGYNSCIGKVKKFFDEELEDTII